MPKTRIEKNGPLAHLVLDDPDEKLNTLGKAMMDEIGARLDELAADASVQAVVIRSGKASGFLAGANLRELQALSTAKDAEAAGYAAARAGQALMDKIEDMPKPVVAAIHGPCLGGGLELALGCHGRVAVEGSAKLGLPELQLGIVPGFGGTYRLPRLIGLVRGLTAILTSSNFDAKKAFKQGLVDDVAASIEVLPSQAEALALKLCSVEGKQAVQARRLQGRPLMERLIEWPGLRGIAFSQSRKEVLGKTRGNYPAPLAALDLVKAHGADRAEGMEREARALGKVLATPVSRNLVRLFFLGQDAKKQAGAGKAAKLKNVTVVGAGFMGSSIAIPLVSRAKLPTGLKDANDEVLGRALKKIEENLQKRVKKRQLSAPDAAAQFNLVSPSSQGQDLRRNDLVIEAVPEILDLKRKVFAELEALLPAHAIIASNTSTLPIAELSAQAKDPSRYIGMHFFSPAELMPLVEIIPSAKTSPETLATVVELTLKMGKTPVVVKDSPGFLINRILLPYILEAVQMVDEGVPVDVVDKSALKFGMPVGPIKLIGEVGAAVIEHVFKILQSHFSDHLPSPQWMGHADFQKWFAKDAAGKVKVDALAIQAAVGKPDPGLPAQDIQDRLFHSMLNEAARCMDEGIVSEPGMLDLGMVYGTGFPPFKGGPLREAEARGLEEVVLRGKTLAGRYGSWLTPPASLAVRRSFYNTPEAG